MSARLMQYLQGRGVTFVVIPHDDEVRRTAHRPRGFAAEEVVNTEVLVTALGHALMVLPETEELDLDLARAALRDPEARPASVAELERSFPDYEPGALPPLGLFFLAPMYVDPSVLERDSVVFRAGRHSLSIAISTHALFRDDPAVITPLIAASAAAGADAG